MIAGTPRVVGKRLPSLAASEAVYVAFHVLALRTKLLHTDEVGHVSFRLVLIPRILGGLKIVKYVQYLVCIRRNTSFRVLIEYRCPNSVLFTDFTEPFATFVLIASLEHFTVHTASLAFTNGFFLRGTLLVVQETRLALKMPLTFGAGDFEVGEGVQRPSHTIATRLIADVCGIT